MPLTAALAAEGALPHWLEADARESVPRRALLVITAIVVVILGGLIAGLGATEDLVRATSALFIAVYVLAILSAIRILDGMPRIAAASALVLTMALAVFSAQFVLVPAVVAVAALVLRRRVRASCAAVPA
jgi:amino acid efflux transporter